MPWTKRILMENHLFLWLRNRTTDNRKCEKARNIKEKRTIGMFSTAWRLHVVHRSSPSANSRFSECSKSAGNLGFPALFLCFRGMNCYTSVCVFVSISHAVQNGSQQKQWASQQRPQWEKSRWTSMWCLLLYRNFNLRPAFSGLHILSNDCRARISV